MRRNGGTWIKRQRDEGRNEGKGGKGRTEKGIEQLSNKTGEGRRSTLEGDMKREMEGQS